MARKRPTDRYGVLDQHVELRKHEHALRRFLEKQRPEPGTSSAYRWAAALSEHLLRYHNRLAQHFHAEQSSGLFDELATRFPRAGGRIRRLVGEHDVFLDDVRRLLEHTLLYAEGREPKNARLRRSSEQFLNRLRRHEETETDLRQRLYTEEIGIGD